jgi:hypothetical protein
MLAKLKQWRADPIGFGQLYRGRFGTWQAWHAFDWPRHVGELEVKVSAEMRVRRYGLILGRTRAGEGGGKVELRFSTEDRTTRFWEEPQDVARARTGELPSTLFAWPTR